MAFKVIQVTLGAAATPIVDGTLAANSGKSFPFQELRLNPAAHDFYLGLSDVSTTKYFAKNVTTAATATIIGNGPSATKIDDLRNLYLLGTQNDVVNVGVLGL
jgi:hypothetical protein